MVVMDLLQLVTLDARLTPQLQSIPHHQVAAGFKSTRAGQFELQTSLPHRQCSLD